MDSVINNMLNKMVIFDELTKDSQPEKNFLQKYRANSTQLIINVSDTVKRNEWYSELSIIKYFTELYTYSKIIITDSNADIYLIHDKEFEKYPRITYVVKFIKKGIFTIGCQNIKYNMTGVLCLNKSNPDAPKPIFKQKTYWFGT